MTCRSTKKAIRAVAVVRAGPEMARQSNCIPVLVASQSVHQGVGYEAVFEALVVVSRLRRAV
jgi:hypothetical protein